MYQYNQKERCSSCGSHGYYGRSMSRSFFIRFFFFVRLNHVVYPMMHFIFPTQAFLESWITFANLELSHK